ncbi:type II toxin-antitoxin system VapC family toxin [Nevskia sp.]|uniref:type II toxin-antitoxin system VapC family toxin n=1 Tax=Nevskia sp. TaxID=1929292 RepID=UPI0025F287F5|nr:type II toxin-antitoxin system VapC family toxin [Nevskia sp.]
MKVTVDTNVLVRAVIGDDPTQAAAARRLMKSAELLAVTLPSLCEFVWVLRRVYELPREDISNAIRSLLSVATVQADRQAAEAGLALFAAGGDFADGVIAFEGERMGATTFASFDRQAVKLLQAAGVQAQLP